jgi:HPt (histidine-containing phosphotransfer) domain-containing protein
VFLRDARRQVDEARQSWAAAGERPIRTADFEQLVRTVHTLKGTAGSVGLPELSTAASEIECSLRSGVAVGAGLPEALARLARLIGEGEHA